jgi:hypothetical protein
LEELIRRMAEQADPETLDKLAAAVMAESYRIGLLDQIRPAVEAALLTCQREQAAWGRPVLPRRPHLPTWEAALAGRTKAIAALQRLVPLLHEAMAMASAPPPAPGDSQAPHAAPSVVLHPDDALILRALAEAGTTKTQDDIAVAVSRTGKTVGIRLKLLRKEGLTHRPRGPRGGDAVTPRGRDAIRDGSS